MFSIRRGTFETNSSSTHSICVCKSYDKIEIPKEIRINLKDYEFGWEYEEYCTTEEKLAYIVHGILDTTYKDGLEETSKKIDKLLSIMKEWVEVVVIQGLEINIYSKYEGKAYLDSEEYGYVDHGNELDELVDALLKDKELLKRYLFSTDSFILTGNDNSDTENEIKVDYEYDEFWKGN